VDTLYAYDIASDTWMTLAPLPQVLDNPAPLGGSSASGPTDANAIQAVTPSEMFSWPGPDAALTMQSERTGIENKWYALKGRVVELKVEEDGDLHVALHDATGDKPGVVVCEIPAKPQ